MLWIKQSTIVTFQLGPFVDATDGATPETGLATAMDNATTGIRVSKNGAVMIDRNSATAPAHDDDGFYRIALSTTDTNTLGTLLVQYEESGVTLPGWKDFMVLPANVFDSFFGADNLQIDQIQIAGTTVPTPATAGIPDVNVREWLDNAVAAAASGVPNVNTTTFLNVAVAAATASGEINANVTEWIETAVTLSGALPDVNVEAMDAASIAAGVIAAAALTEIEDEIWDALKSAHVVPNSFGDFLDIEVSGRLAAADINLTAGVLDEVATLTGQTAQTGDSFARIGAAGVSLTDLGGMSTGMKAEILVEVNAALDAAISELGVGVPATTPSIRTGIMLMYMALRNQLDVATSGTDTLEIHNNAGTRIAQKLLTDAGGDYSEALMITGA